MPRCRRRLSIELAILLLALTTVGACGDGLVDLRKGRGTPGLRIVSGAGVADTITAILPQPLVIEYRDSDGFPVRDAWIVVVGITSLDGPEVQFEHAPGAYTPQLHVRTDSVGRVRARVRMGEKAGIARVRLHKDHFSPAMDSASFTVLPGAPARVALAPRDTALFSGRSLTPRSRVTDRGGNPLTAAVQYRVLDGPATVTQPGTVNTTAYGTVRVIGTSGTGADTVRIASVPHGAFAGRGWGGDLFVANLDGSGFRIVAFRGAIPAWDPTGQRLVYGGTGGLHTVTMDGEQAALMDAPPPGDHLWPQYSRDGSRIYFFTAAHGEPHTLWSVGADGTGPARVGGSGYQADPSVSPDGGRLVFANGYSSNAKLRVRDLATGVESADLVAGMKPTWAPDSERIVFSEIRQNGFSAGIAIINADGTGYRRISAEGVIYFEGPDWSPDGRWVIATEWSRKVHLIEVDTGLTIILPFWESVARPVWRPSGPLP
jgi:hypothetical protein